MSIGYSINCWQLYLSHLENSSTASTHDLPPPKWAQASQTCHCRTQLRVSSHHLWDNGGGGKKKTQNVYMRPHSPDFGQAIFHTSVKIQLAFVYTSHLPLANSGKAPTSLRARQRGREAQTPPCPQHCAHTPQNTVPNTVCKENMAY